MLSHLPQELIELILSYLDVKNVLACALLSSSLVAPSQRLIFRKLVIRIPHPDSPDSDTEASFAAASHISRYVRDLKVHLNSEAESFASQNGLLASILPSFHHLQGLSIKGRFGWNDITLPLQSAIHNLMTSTNLRSLKLNRIFDLPPSIIVQALSSLRTLGLYRVIVKPSETDVLDLPVTLRTEKIILRTLYPNIKSIVDLILPDIPTPGYLDNIKWLVVSMDGSFTRVESRRLIAATASTLCHLELRCQMFETILDLPTLPVLQLLELKISLGFGAPLPPNLYLAVAALPTAVPVIEILRLTFNAIYPRFDSLANDDAGPLPLFNDAAYREKLLCLRRVHCRGWPGHTSRGCVDFSTYIHSKFLGLCGTEVLEVSVHGDEGTSDL